MKQQIPPDEFYDLATQVTDNDMFNSGSWMAPVLHAGEDPRSRQPIHYFAEDTRLSVCGNNFLPESYVETIRDDEEIRPDCAHCWQLITAHQRQSRLDPRDEEKRHDFALDKPLIVPEDDVYSQKGFVQLLGGNSGTQRIALNITRMKIIDDDLFLMVDAGVTPCSSIRRTLKRIHAHYDEVVLVGTDAFWDIVDDAKNAHQKEIAA